MTKNKNADEQKHAMLSRARWERLRQESPARVLAELAGDELPSSLAGRMPPGSFMEPWSVHARLWTPRNDNLPGALIGARVECANGMSASVVYGCRSALFESWQLTLAGPWELEIGIAARVGDEARGEMCACFELGSEPPRPARNPSSFEEDSAERTGSSTALVETRRVGSAVGALSLLASLASAWDAPEQALLWALARTGAPGTLAGELARAPIWASRPWSKGSSLLALCLRLGRWESVAEVVRACPPEALVDLAPEASRALAALCNDLSPTWPAALAVDAIGRAWVNGVRLCPQSFCDALGTAETLREAGRAAWRRAEERALSSTCSSAAGASLRRL